MNLQPPQLSEEEALAAASVAASGGVRPERDNSSSTSDSSRSQIIHTLTSSPDLSEPPGARAAPVQPLPFKMPPEIAPMAKRIKFTSPDEAHALGWHLLRKAPHPERYAAFKAPPPECPPYNGIVAEQVAAQQGHPKAAVEAQQRRPKAPPPVLPPRYEDTYRVLDTTYIPPAPGSLPDP